MRFKTPLQLAALLLFTCPAALAQEGPRKDEQVIEDFVVTRGASPGEQGQQTKKRATTRPAARVRRTHAAGKVQGGAASGKTPPRRGVGAARPGEGGAARPLALGYTILLKDEAGGLFVADAAHEFKTGDRFAVALETNEDGYLYMFSATGGRNPELLFPNAQIDGGANAVQAHARATLPSGPGADTEYFIDVTGPPAAEHLFIIFSRRPLADVPAGEALVEFCGQNLEDCAWRPTGEQWARILGGAKARRVTEAKNPQLRAQAGTPHVAPGMLQRSLRVRREDPSPSVVRVNDSPDVDLLVTEIVLTHK